jgi:hypothetical protein
MVAISITAAAIGGDVAVGMGLTKGLEIRTEPDRSKKLAGFAGAVPIPASGLPMKQHGTTRWSEEI